MVKTKTQLQNMLLEFCKEKNIVTDLEDVVDTAKKLSGNCATPYGKYSLGIISGVIFFVDTDYFDLVDENDFDGDEDDYERYCKFINDIGFDILKTPSVLANYFEKHELAQLICELIKYEEDEEDDDACCIDSWFRYLTSNYDLLNELNKYKELAFEFEGKKIYFYNCSQRKNS